MRTLLAFLFAPAAAVIGVSVAGATFDGLSWFDAFGQYAVGSVFACYISSYVFGLPFFLMLRFKRWETLRNYLLTGALAGLVFFAVLISLAAPQQHPAIETIGRGLLAAIACAALGALVAASFAWISGVKRSDNPAARSEGHRT